jgi:hypothetical protein
VYAAQNLTGNLIANQAVYFFKRKQFSSALVERHMLTQSQRLAFKTPPLSPWV